MINTSILQTARQTFSRRNQMENNIEHVLKRNLGFIPLSSAKLTKSHRNLLCRNFSVNDSSTKRVHNRVGSTYAYSWTGVACRDTYRLHRSLFSPVMKPTNSQNRTPITHTINYILRKSRVQKFTANSISLVSILKTAAILKASFIRCT